MLTERLEAADKLEQWMQTRFHNVQVDSSDRVRLSLALHDLTQELHSAIALLLRRQNAGPAFALLRTTFETLVRATWLFRAATEEELDDYQTERPLPTFAGMIRVLVATPYIDWFKAMKDHAWSSMCSYAHGGMMQASRRIIDGAIAPHYSEEEQVEVLRMAGFLALLSSLECAAMFDRADIGAEALAMAREWYPEIAHDLT